MTASYAAAGCCVMPIMSHSTPRPLDDCLAQMDRSAEFRQAFNNKSVTNDLPYAQALLDAESLFEALGGGYAFVGGIASIFFSQAQFSENIQLVIAIETRETLERTCSTVHRHHFDRNFVGELRHRSGIPINILKDNFSDDIVHRAQTVALADQPIRIAERHDLIAMKLQVNLIQDDYDISEIIKAGGVDEAILIQRVAPVE